MSQYWFRAREGLASKDAGWGYIPISWDGVVPYVLLLGVVIGGAFVFDLAEPTVAQGFGIFVVVVVAMALFSLISRTKTHP